ncbi:MAG TPA: galactokinase [Gemmatimonadaceae bacterium]|nr:galactokinase [Gemmatimonadaceae bacterium]
MTEQRVAADGDLSATVVREFVTRFGEAPSLIARAPGRVNLIGDHTDYNDGFVLPMAIDRATWIALRPRADGRVVLHSLDFGEVASFDAAEDGARGSSWTEYPRGIAWALRQSGAGATRGWEGVSVGNVPVGAGLSSSASLELAVARAFAGVAGLPWDAAAMARLAQRAENEWVGVNCGIMDQLISAAGVAGHALLIDCRTLATRPVPLPATAAVVVLDTATRRGLVDSAYNERRQQCEAAAAHFAVDALRDVTEADLARDGASLDPVIRRRARHVVTENARTVAAAAALDVGDLGRMGSLMSASHASLRDDFAVSRPELDLMVTLAEGHAACYGARMTGAGFGGCAVALVATSGAADFAAEIAARYRRATGLDPSVYVCIPSAGATLVDGGR